MDETIEMEGEPGGGAFADVLAGNACDPSSDPQVAVLTLGMATFVCNLGTGEAEAETVYRSHWPASPAGSVAPG